MRKSLVVLLLCAAVGHAADVPSGVIIDARKLDLKRCRFPKLFAPDGRLLYPTDKLADSPRYQQGFAGYKPTVAEAKQDNKRLGAAPIVLLPEKVHKGDPTGGSMDVTEEQAQQLEQWNKANGLLDKDRVAVVFGVSVLRTAPAAGAKDVEPKAAVDVYFSTPLRLDVLKRGTPVTVTDSKGQAVEGKLQHFYRDCLISFEPAAPWRAGETYTVKVSAAVQADNRAALGEEYVFSFTVPAPASDKDTPPAGDNKNGVK